MKKLAWLLVSPLLASPLCAADLMQVYREAQANDATFAAVADAAGTGTPSLWHGPPVVWP